MDACAQLDGDAKSKFRRLFKECPTYHEPNPRSLTDKSPIAVDWVIAHAARLQDITALDCGAGTRQNVLSKYKLLLKRLGFKIDDARLHQSDECLMLKKLEAKLCLEKQKEPVIFSTTAMAVVFERWHAVAPFSREALTALFLTECCLGVRGPFLDRCKVYTEMPAELEGVLVLPDTELCFTAFRDAFREANANIKLPRGGYMLLLPGNPYPIALHAWHKTSERFQVKMVMSTEFGEYLMTAMLEGTITEGDTLYGERDANGQHASDLISQKLVSRKTGDTIGINALRHASRTEIKQLGAHDQLQHSQDMAHNIQTAMRIYQHVTALPLEQQLDRFFKHYPPPEGMTRSDIEKLTAAKQYVRLQHRAVWQELLQADDTDSEGLAELSGLSQDTDSVVSEPDDFPRSPIETNTATQTEPESGIYLTPQDVITILLDVTQGSKTHDILRKRRAEQINEGPAKRRKSSN
jgi:hypothetical protein